MEERVRFKAGDLELDGLLHCPQEAVAGVVVCHPHPLYGGNMYNFMVEAVCSALQEAGIATLRFDFRGVGLSEGEYDNGEGEIADALAAVTLLASRLSSEARIGICGYSFGGMVALRVCAADDRVSALADIAPVVEPPDVLAKWPKPKLFIVGTNDDWVDPQHTALMVSVMPDPKEIRFFQGASHFFGRREKEVAAVIASFFTANLIAS